MYTGDVGDRLSVGVTLPETVNGDRPVTTVEASPVVRSVTWSETVYVEAVEKV